MGPSAYVHTFIQGLVYLVSRSLKMNFKSGSAWNVCYETFFVFYSGEIPPVYYSSAISCKCFLWHCKELFIYVVHGCEQKFAKRALFLCFLPQNELIIGLISCQSDCYEWQLHILYQHDKIITYNRNFINQDSLLSCSWNRI